MRASIAVALLAGVLLAGCGGPEQKARDAAEQLRSWNATLELLRRQRDAGALPEPFLRQVVGAAEEARARAEAQRRQSEAR